MGARKSPYAYLAVEPTYSLEAQGLGFRIPCRSDEGFMEESSQVLPTILKRGACSLRRGFDQSFVLSSLFIRGFACSVCPAFSIGAVRIRAWLGGYMIVSGWQ